MEDSVLKRFGVSMESSLLRRFDELVRKRGYENRSEAVRDLVRDALIQHSWEEHEQLVAGSLLLFYNHHQSNLLEEMTQIQHQGHHLILATTHFHLDESSCLEIIVVKGKGNEIEQLSNRLTSLKGVDYGKFTIAPVAQI
ncbi:nickel-responsive transcriptional regulator NikR [Metabacillus malikii]|uniref:Putative nickel-responsive regulator n=1 Tax=Metabacillus malikii TaxID=1504265 RepID=A0ABT9ZLB4_9BACI|nr:nickel-responsive transcriptional regulator NikR [Metabacillus malikii]MDQ0233063.1 CopG family nickel-responsive transcriptional regulator [Metabacillus malikii]